VKNSHTPTVGRIVHYYRGADTPEQAAIVTSVPPVGEDGQAVVNIQAFQEQGFNHNFRGVPIGDAGEKPKDGKHFCTWMPFQVKQHELLKRLDTPAGAVVLDELNAAQKTQAAAT
jgi:hypothetical protein